MSFLLHSKHARKEVEKMIKEHVDKMRRTYSWSGEHKEITKEILNYLRYGKKKVANNA
tara:strand:+ start:752 stop:925 length:174 start_codon:yes stop_codon:yes gene_type:complete